MKNDKLNEDKLNEIRIRLSLEAFRDEQYHQNKIIVIVLCCIFLALVYIAFKIAKID